MYKPKPRFLHLFLLILISVGLFACNQPKEQFLPELQGIEVDIESLTNEYDIEDFTMQGMMLILYYDDGTTEKIPITPNMMSLLDTALLSTPGTHAITITHGKFTTTLNLTMTYTGLSQQLRHIFHQGLQSGLITGTYEEWLDSIKGADGNSIISASINEEGHLILTFSNEDVLDVGRVTGIKGQSAYDFYRTYFPDYEGDEQQWLDDLINGRLGQPDQVIISFEAMDGDMPDGYNYPVTTNINTTITLPVPTREGYEFMGWYTGFVANDSQVSNATPMTKTITLYAKWMAIRTITFESNGGTSIEPISGTIGSLVQRPDNPEKETFSFEGWFTENTFENKYAQFTTIPYENITLHAKWRWNHQVNMVSVGEKGMIYTIPTGTGDVGTANVAGGYRMATTQTTYELWYEVKEWAIDHGYHFQNYGREGGDGIIGAAPTARKHEPVTSISWRDVVIWMNALSEMTGLDPVYRTPGGVIIRNSTTSNSALVDAAIQTNNNGYRLSTSMEFEMAARWRNGGGAGSILVGERYWTPGSYASGATADYNDATATQFVAWYSENSGSKAQAVGQKAANHLGIYDMSGNVYEWTYTTSGTYRALRGGSCLNYATFIQVGFIAYNYPYASFNSGGFRIVRDP